MTTSKLKQKWQANPSSGQCPRMAIETRLSTEMPGVLSVDGLLLLGEDEVVSASD